MTEPAPTDDAAAAAPRPWELPATTPVDPAQARALLCELAQTPEGVSLPRLCKRLQWRMSVLLRVLAWLGEAPVGAQPGAGWVRVDPAGERSLARLTALGREAARTDPLLPRAGEGI